MTHTAHIGALIVAALPDYTAVDIRSFDLDQYLELVATQTATPQVFCRGLEIYADESTITDDGTVRLHAMQVQAFLMAPPDRDIDADTETLVDTMNADLDNRTYTRGDDRWIVIPMSVEDGEAEYGLPLKRIILDISRI